ncbi:MAG TPA: hypothetical protein VLG14_19930 [Sphingomonas sp.]|jgi:hypothetical protein|nr:hypothetical protein [Sphingomonas sp.]
MKMVLKPASAALCMALAMQSVQAAERETAECMPARNAEALVLMIAPALITQMQQRCTSVLPADAYLLRSGPALVAKYEAAAAAVDTEAMEAFRFFGGSELAELKNETLRPLIREQMAKGLAGEFKVDDCAGFDLIFSNLDPLPPANLARVLIAIVQTMDNGSKTNRKRKKPDICPALAKP